MTNTGYSHFAEALVFAHGPKALMEATRHAELALRSGDQEMAAHWLSAIDQIKSAKTLQFARAA
jgi:hypothetical protein